MNTKDAFLGKMEQIYVKLNHNLLIMSIREGLVGLIPVLIVGTFAIVGNALPIPAYQNFITSIFGGIFCKLFTSLNQGTFGLLSVYMVIILSWKYNDYRNVRQYDAGAVFSAVSGFAILSGIMTPDTFNISYLGPTGMFTATVSAITAVWIYGRIYQMTRSSLRLYATGTGTSFYQMLRSIIPVFVNITFFSVVNLTVMQVFHVDCFQTWFSEGLAGLFYKMESSLGAMVVFLLSAQGMWFFGIHGSNVLNSTKQVVWIAATEKNMELVAAGKEATEIVNGTFLDVFILLGGCGATWALLLALLFFSKRRSNRSLAKIAAIPMIFNINEIMVFGLPIVCNPIFLIPFVLTPIVILFISYFATACGIVPIAVESVEWTTPIFLSGYLATGSIAGVILQLVNLVVGVLIYAPFVKICDRVMASSTKEKMKRLVDILKRGEENREPIELLALKDEFGGVAKNLADELEEWVKSKDTMLYYQPQYNHKGEFVGAEALLRWDHPVYGMMYPPLVIKLAEETGNLIHMEKEIFKKVALDIELLLPMLGKPDQISVNVTGTTIQQEEFEVFLRTLKQEHPKACEHIMIEITEQSALRIDKMFIDRLMRLRELGYEFGIDDFSMGSTSVKYLQSNIFSLVKLDGAISKDILNNRRSKEIISSIAQLTHELGISVLAEYVETEEQRRALEEVGCYLYQGYLYSPAVTLEELMMKCL